MFAEEVLIEIDTTLDQLIRNAEMIQNVDLEELSETEVDAFKKTQESLVQHLLHMDQFFETRKNNDPLLKKQGPFKIQEKLLKFDRLKKEYNQNLNERIQSWHRREFLMKRRAKKFLRDN
ncbi:MAG: hypothetical protein JSS32_10000 [Verrucomicrobia bacterium]|nr:hypothetical protein [Verrucomicrobiota bacterium]